MLRSRPRPLLPRPSAASAPLQPVTLAWSPLWHGQTLGIHRDVTLDAQDPIARVIALLPCRICVLCILRIHDQERALGAAPKVSFGPRQADFLERVMKPASGRLTISSAMPYTLAYPLTSFPVSPGRPRPDSRFGLSQRLIQPRHPDMFLFIGRRCTHGCRCSSVLTTTRLRAFTKLVAHVACTQPLS